MTREVICQKMAPILDLVNVFWVFSLLGSCGRIWTVNHIDDQIFSVRFVSGSPILGTVIATGPTMTPGRMIKACGSRIKPM